MDSLGTRLKMLRQGKHYSAEQAVRAINRKGYDLPRPWTQATLTKWENDTRTPKAEELRILADFYNTSADYILGRVDDSVFYSDIDEVADYLNLSTLAVANLVRRVFPDGSWISDALVSEILESELLPEALRVLSDSRDGIARQIRHCEGDVPPRFREQCFDMAEMYVMKAHKAVDPLLREVLHYNLLIKEEGETTAETEAEA